mmetsp:Transcript_37153/g.87106  ORF Transcript_37153/g.87106 Transcript_37153/m.87106 type:complete len:242 (-) Transcript_37153:263-988(-)
MWSFSRCLCESRAEIPGSLPPLERSCSIDPRRPLPPAFGVCATSSSRKVSYVPESRLGGRLRWDAASPSAVPVASSDAPPGACRCAPAPPTRNVRNVPDSIEGGRRREGVDAGVVPAGDGDGAGWVTPPWCSPAHPRSGVLTSGMNMPSVRPGGRFLPPGVTNEGSAVGEVEKRGVSWWTAPSWFSRELFGGSACGCGECSAVDDADASPAAAEDKTIGGGRLAFRPGGGTAVASSGPSGE